MEFRTLRTERAEVVNGIQDIVSVGFVMARDINAYDCSEFQADEWGKLFMSASSSLSMMHKNGQQARAFDTLIRIPNE